MPALIDRPESGETALPDDAAKGKAFRIARYGAPVAWIFGRNEMDPVVETEETTDLVARPTTRKSDDDLSKFGLVAGSSRR